MTKLIQDKVQFYGGWLVTLLGISAILLFIFGFSSDLEKIPKNEITPLLVIIFGGAIVMILTGNGFIERGLQTTSQGKCLT